MSVNATNRSILSNYLLGQGSSSTQGRNYVRNEFARDGVANVTASGTATVAKNTTTPLTAISDFLITLPNNATDYVEWALDTLDNSLTNQNCQLTLDYKIGSIGSVVQAQVLIGGVVSNSQRISSSPTQSSVSLNVPCGDLSGATTVRIANAAGNTGTSSINVANVNYGKATNIGTVAQSFSAGTLSFPETSGCSWAITQSTYASDFSAQASCPTATVTGLLTSPSKTPQVTYTSPNGIAEVKFSSRVTQSANAAAKCRIIDDLSNVLVEVGLVTDSTTAAPLNLIGQKDYSAIAGARTFKVQCLSTSGSVTLSAATGNGAAQFSVTSLPTTSQQAVTPAQQKAPTVQRFTSGSGTYTTPSGVTYIKVRVAGAGGGGGGGGNSGGSAGGTGGNTTFGTSLLTANGGAGGSGQNVGGSMPGGIGGTATVSAPAVSLVALSGGNGLSGSSEVTAGYYLNGGGMGGVNPIFSGAGAGGGYNQAGVAGTTNTGGGGQGGSADNFGNRAFAAGGGAGGAIEALISNPSLTYTYSVGTAGTAGTAGGSGQAGGAGGSGVIEVTEYYSQSAPILIGSVTSNSTNALRIEYVKFGTTSNSVCSASPCAYTRSSSAWFTNVTRSSVGFYTVNVPSGTFSDIPVCTCSVGSAGNTARHCFFNDRESLTAIPVAISNSAGSAVDGEVSINCIGPR